MQRFNLCTNNISSADKGEETRKKSGNIYRWIKKMDLSGDEQDSDNSNESKRVCRHSADQILKLEE